MSKETVAIIDYGSGNLRSAEKAFARVIGDAALDFNVIVTDKAEDILKADRIVLPGQGAFGSCMKGLSNLEGMIESLEESVLQRSVPFLGICVGMQLLASRGLEHGVHGGLGWIKGEVKPLEPDNDNLKIPHMGWNELVMPFAGEQDNRHFVLRSTDSLSGNLSHYYFVHSFMFDCKNNHHVLGMCDYGGLFPAVVGRDNIVGVQFHPEKSQESGLRLISDFLHWKP